MNIQELQKAGAFVSAKAVKKTVEWVREVDGVEKKDAFDIFVKKMSAGEREILSKDLSDKSISATLIAACLRESEDGGTLLLYEQAFELDTGLAHLFIEAINEVNASKNSKPTTSSGTN